MRTEAGGWASAALVEAAQRGDVVALEQLVAGADPHVRRFAARLCATEQDAQDAAQEALIILYRKVGMLRASRALGSWIFQVVRNECVRRAKAARERALPVHPFPHVAESSAEDQVLRAFEQRRVAEAIAALPEAGRRVLVMRDIQGLPGPHVARTLGLSVAAMKSQLHRARAALREALAADYLSDI